MNHKYRLLEMLFLEDRFTKPDSVILKLVKQVLRFSLVFCVCSKPFVDGASHFCVNFYLTR